jgi:type IV pilus assembly protein PilM
VAIKSDLLDEINEAVEASSLKANTIDVSPMALYNAYRYNYSDLAGCSLVIDIGARTTNLIFIESKKVFSRSIPTGGNTITAAIAKDFNEGFGEAEERKKRDGFVSLGGAYADPDDPDAARISKITRNTMTRLHAEITRSISFYRSQQGGSAPVRVFLAGGTASMPYMREFFQEKFQMPVEFFNPLRNVRVGGKLNVEEIGHKAHTLGPIVGLALRNGISCPMELNLRPASVIRRETETRQRPAFIVAALCLLAGLAVAWLYFDRAAKTTASAVKALHPTTTALPESLADVEPASTSQPTVETLQEFEKKLNDVRSQVKAQEQAAAPLLEAARERQYWTQLLNDVNARLPKEYLWITLFQPTQRKTPPPTPVPGAKPTPAPRGKPGAAEAPKPQTVIELEGLYLYNDRGPAVIDDFVSKLKESDLYTVEPKVREVQNDTDWAFRYTMTLVPKKPIAYSPLITSKE